MFSVGAGGAQKPEIGKNEAIPRPTFPRAAQVRDLRRARLTSYLFLKASARKQICLNARLLRIYEYGVFTKKITSFYIYK